MNNLPEALLLEAFRNEEMRILVLYMMCAAYEGKNCCGCDFDTCQSVLTPLQDPLHDPR